MNETTKINHCERAVELVAYFYGEATREERAGFDAHLARCGACREELTAFAGVREAVGHWRTEILDAAPLTPFAEPAAEKKEASREVAVKGGRREDSVSGTAPRRDERLTQPPSATRPAARPRSARAAFREFFRLSPPWLRAGMAAAALVVCARAGLAFFNSDNRRGSGGLAVGTRPPVETQAAPHAPVSASDGQVNPQAELDKLVAERDAALRELEDTRSQLDASREANLIAAVEMVEPVSASRSNGMPDNASRRVRRAAPAAPVAPARRRSRSDRDEEDTLRLYDLLTEAN